ncbi:MAG: T9SS type A sorting domain-containing protein, partial [Bacteroidota bacterium]
FNIQNLNKGEPTIIDVIDITGKSIYKSTISGKSETFINLEGSPDGCYFLKVYSESESRIFRIVIIH